MMIYRLFFLLIIFTNSLNAIFEKDHAAYAYHCNDLQKADELFESLITQKPDDYASLYNVGKIAYKQQKFERAQAYLEQACRVDSAPLSFKEQSFFDLGNTHVQLKKWQEALENYESVVKINPDHEAAKKMVEQLKRKLEEEKQQKDNQKQQSDESKKDKSDQEQGEDKEENTSDQQEDQQEKNNENKTPEKDEDTNKPSQDNKNDDQKQSDYNDQSNEQQEDKQQDNEQDTNKKNDQNNNQQEQSQTDNQSSAETKEDQKNELQKQQAAQTDDQKHKDQQGQLNKAEQKKDEIKDAETELLELIESRDAATVKKLLQAQLKNEKSQYGQKNW